MHVNSYIHKILKLNLRFLRDRIQVQQNPYIQCKVQAKPSPLTVIDACRPFEGMKDFPPVAESSPELKEKVRKKWKSVIDG